MNKYLIAIAVIFLLVISGCSNSSNYPEENTRGVGLEISLQTDQRWVNLLQVGYSLKIKNSGNDPITLTRENFRLGTDMRPDGISEIFTKESIDEFYSKILGSQSELTVYRNQELHFSGILNINEEFYNNINNDGFTYFLLTNYEYETRFDNNLQLTVSEKRLRSDTISQAAPVQVTDIELIPRPGDIYAIGYNIEDRGPSRNDRTTNIQIRSLNLQFSNQPLSLGDCRYFGIEQNNRNTQLDPSNLMINNRFQKILVSCDIDVSSFDKNTPTNIKTSGSFSYQYTLRNEGTVRFPKERNQLIY